MGADTAKLLREIRYALRVERDGYLVSSLVDPDKHGTSMSYMSYGCRCQQCRTWQNDRCREQAAERRRQPPAETPEVVVEDLEYAREPPPMIPSVRTRIESVAMLRKISDAYYTPEWQAPVIGHEGRERRAFGTMQIIVGRDHSIIAFSEREVGTGTSEVLTPTKKATPRSHGTGGGSRRPSSYRSLMDQLSRAGCTLTTTGSGHIKASKDGRSVILPSTSSDWRSLLNAVSDARKQGLL